MSYTRTTRRIKSIHLQYLKETGTDPPTNYPYPAQRDYVEWLEDKLERLNDLIIDLEGINVL